LAKMKREAYLVNTARASLVDQTALISALSEGRLAGAAVDVFPIEPPGSDHPLLQLANVIATPHVGGNTFEVFSHQGTIVATDLAELLRGKQPRHVANREILEHFSWTAPRPVPSPEVLARLRQNSRPALTDLPPDSEKTSSAAKAPPVVPPHGAKKEGLLSELKNTFLGRRPASVDAPAVLDAEPWNAHPNGHQNGRRWGATDEMGGQMERLLGTFGQRLSRDERILSFAEGRQVTVRYELNDVKLSFYRGFDRSEEN